MDTDGRQLQECQEQFSDDTALSNKSHGIVIKAASVIDCIPTEVSITQAMGKLFSQKFSESVKHTTSPFGVGGVAEKIVKTIENIPLAGIIKKKFYNLE